MPILLFVLGLLLGIIALPLLVRGRKVLGFIILLLGVLGIALAYGLRPTEEDVPQKITTIRIHGSRTLGRSLMPKLVEKFFELEGYTLVERELHQDFLRLVASHPDYPELLSIEIIAKGSMYGFEQLMTQKCELAMASAAIDSAIIADLGIRFNAKKHEHIIAYDAVQLIVHPYVGTKIEDLDTESIGNVLRGKLNSWSALSDSLEGTIHCYLRDAQSGTFHYLEELYLKEIPLRKDAKQLSYFEQIANEVAKDSVGVGFVNYAIDKRLLEDVKVLNVSAKDSLAYAPTYQNIKDGNYPLARPLFLYHTRDVENNKLLQAFISFCKQTEAHTIIIEEGLVPLKGLD